MARRPRTRSRTRNGSATSSRSAWSSRRRRCSQAQALVNRNIVADHARFLDHVEQVAVDGADEPLPAIRDFPRFATRRPRLGAGRPRRRADGGPRARDARSRPARVRRDAPPDLRRPRVRSRRSGDRRWLLLDPGAAGSARRLDEVAEADDDQRWQASPQARFERLLARDAGARSACSSNGTHLRLVYAPRGETLGPRHLPRRGDDRGRGPADLRRPAHAARRPSGCSRCPTSSGCRPSWPRAASTRTPSRPSSPSRCWPPCTSCSAASRRPTTSGKGELLRDVLARRPGPGLRRACSRVLMRLVFLLYAEDRGLMSGRRGLRQVLLGHRPVRAAPRGRRPLPRHDGPALRRVGAAADAVPPGLRRRPARRASACRPGRLPVRPRPLPVPRRPAARLAAAAGRADRRRRWSPTAWSSACCRTCSSSTASGSPTARSTSSRSARSTRRSWASAWRWPRAGRSPSSRRRRTAPRSTINLDALLAVKPADRGEVAEGADRPEGRRARPLTALKAADDGRGRWSRPWSGRWPATLTPNIVPAGAMVLQPSRRAPPVGLALHAALAHRADRPRRRSEPSWSSSASSRRPEQILDLKVCDPAMGSGAFLVEACRQLGDALVKAWHAHGELPTIPPDEDEVLHAQPDRWPSAASTAWTRTRWRWTWPSCRSGWRRWRRTTRSRSSTTPCGAATRWSG